MPRCGICTPRGWEFPRGPRLNGLSALTRSTGRERSSFCSGSWSFPARSKTTANWLASGNRRLSKITDIRPVAARLYFLPVRFRVPLKFGTEVTHQRYLCAGLPDGRRSPGTAGRGLGRNAAGGAMGLAQRSALRRAPRANARVLPAAGRGLADDQCRRPSAGSGRRFLSTTSFPACWTNLARTMPSRCLIWRR